MKRFLSFGLGIFVALASATVIAEPENLTVAREAVIRYHDSGQYEKDINKVMQNATNYLKKEIAHPKPGQKPAIILDIDETSLSNYPTMLKMNFGGTFEQIQQAEDEALDPAIDATLKFYKLAKENNIAVFFITGRKEFERKATEANLKNAGYSDWNGLILRSSEFEHAPADVYKSAMRKKITEDGYTIIINIGDQKSDLTGAYSGKTFKLPDPYYFIP